MKKSRLDHNKDIEQTRSMGFGGSDAAMAVEIADRLYNNITLTLTQKKRLRVIAGIDHPQPSVDTPEITSGRDWEDTMADRLMPNGFDREHLLMWQGDPFKHFAVFAHADFFRSSDGMVVECKWTAKKTPSEIMQDYKWQYAQYILLGAKSVNVAIRIGEADNTIPWEDNNGYADQLLAAYRLIDERWDTIDLAVEERDFSQLPPEVMQAVKDMEWLKEEIATREEKYKEAQAVVRLWMEQADVQKVGGERYQLTYTPATEAVKFDSKGLKDAYPKIYEQFCKYTLRSASVRMTERK